MHHLSFPPSCMTDEQTAVVSDALAQDRALQSEVVVGAARSQGRRTRGEEGEGLVP